jgi:hypothetical protein
LKFPSITTWAVRTLQWSWSGSWSRLDLDAGGRFIPAGFIYSVHSVNPVGKGNIEGVFEAYLRQREISVDRPAAW